MEPPLILKSKLRKCRHVVMLWFRNHSSDFCVGWIMYLSIQLSNIFLMWYLNIHFFQSLNHYSVTRVGRMLYVYDTNNDIMLKLSKFLII